MFKEEHPPPHLHGKYAGRNFVVSLSDGEVTEGYAPAKVARRVKEWVGIHKEELIRNWDLLQAMQLPNKVSPLD